MTNPYLERIAKYRSRSLKEARQFCLEVQALQQLASSFKSISLTCEELSPDASTQAIAHRAAKIHVPSRKTQVPSRQTQVPSRKTRVPSRKKRRKRRRGKLRWQPSKTPKYIVVGGVVERTTTWNQADGSEQGG